MKIALLTDGVYPFVTGGMQRHSYFLAKYLARKKVFVRVYHCITDNFKEHYEQTLKNIFSEDELQYLEFVIIPFDFSSKFPGYYILESYRYSKRIYSHLLHDINQFDFIYSKGFTAWYLLRNKKEFFPPIGIKLHGYEMYQYAIDLKTKLQHLLLRIPAKYVTQKADVVFSYGGKITEILLNKLHIDKNKIVELSTGIERNLIADKETEYHQPVRFVYVGRYEKRKGIENIHGAIHFLIEKKISFEFHFIGEIPEHLKIRDKRVVYYGKINEYSKISEILRQCDVLVCPSYSEGMPNVIVEAMANGLSVIATDVGAVGLLVNNNTGYLIKDNKVSTLYEALSRAIDEKQKVLQDKKQAALLHIQNFVWEKIADNLVREIKKFVLPR